jgi:predicted RNase H-like HicB family nuclease
MTHYPLLYARRELVEGNGFIAGVAVSGRALMAEEDGAFWVEGVNPGGFAANGNSPSEAVAEFCTAFRAVLFDIAHDARSFEEFSEEVSRFFNETSPPALAEWEEAVRQVRAGAVNADWLTKRSADSVKLGIEVVLVRQPSADHNDLGEAALAA